ncbi:type III ribulose-bisphosphate carboxylase [Candidatus Pacearchaeota archaeon]|nr:type III ribulose-bisphosphate carboxylase [Candidatus Pacearchaeota archaeon]
MSNKQAYKYKSFVNLKYKPKSTDLILQFRIYPSAGFDLKEAASMVAGESSIGTWTEVKTMKSRIAKKLTPKVFYIDSSNNRVRIAYPIDLFELGNLPNILSSVGGNIYGMKSVKGLFWEDVNIPKKMLKSFKGPRFGIKGVRKYLDVYDRPLVGTIVKPKVGLTGKEHAKVAYESWLGGCDVVKDDENLANQNFNKFQKRVKLTLKALKKAEKETGEKKVYLANCTAETEEMKKRIKFVEDNGGNYVMLDIITLGWAAVQTARNFTKLPIHAHRAGHAMFDRIENSSGSGFGMSMEVIAQFARMIGVDTLHIGTAYGKMSGAKDEVLHIEEEVERQFTKKTKENLSQKWHGVKPVFGVASGGVYPGMVPKIIEFMGKDIVLQAGGGIHGHPGGSEKGAKAMRQAVDAGMKKIPLKEYAKTHSELKIALNKWGE